VSGQDGPRSHPLLDSNRKRHIPSPQTFYIDDIENRVLSALREEMKSPAVIAEYVKTYIEERQRLAAKIERQRATKERKIGELLGSTSIYRRCARSASI
jgi:hypothetical protein